jgi:hypothetical protein
MMQALEVTRTALHDAKIVSAPLPALAPGQVLMAVEQFALTANTITYAVFGEMMRYWDFFPASAPDQGRIPAWGFMQVAASTVPEVPVGERFYGYVPIGSHFVVTPQRIGAQGFFDASPHRAHLSLFYNLYSRCAADPGYRADQEPQQALLRPLFMTGFLLEDYVDDNNAWGVKQLILTSASSKTALATALRAKARGTLTVVGLTSPSNLAFVQASGAYDALLTYDHVSGLSAEPAVLVDMAGNPAVVANVHAHLATVLTQSIMVGGTHWEAATAAPRAPVAGIQPALFFAPAQIEKRRADWGPGGLEQHFAAAWVSDVARASGWLRVVNYHGTDAVLAMYQQMLSGKVDPAEGHMLSLATR